jgi:hypothetical protein
MIEDGGTYFFWAQAIEMVFQRIHFIYRIVYREEEEDKRRRRRGFAMMRFSNVMSTRVGGCRTARRFRLMNSRIISDIWRSFLSPPPLFILHPCLGYDIVSPFFFFRPHPIVWLYLSDGVHRKMQWPGHRKVFFFTINKNGQPSSFFKRRKI